MVTPLTSSPSPRAGEAARFSLLALALGRAPRHSSTLHSPTWPDLSAAAITRAELLGWKARCTMPFLVICRAGASTAEVGLTPTTKLGRHAWQQAACSTQPGQHHGRRAACSSSPKECSTVQLRGSTKPDDVLPNLLAHLGHISFLQLQPCQGRKGR